MRGEVGAKLRVGAYRGGTVLSVGRTAGVGVRKRVSEGSEWVGMAVEEAGHSQFECRKSD